MTNPALEHITTREMTPADAAGVARLSEELGYLATPDVMQRRIESLQGSSNRAAYVACHGDELVGWMDLTATNHLASEPRVEIGGLIVASGFRSRGIGRLLIACAERWALERGLKMILVRSRDTREAAHRFYLREGFVRTKHPPYFQRISHRIIEQPRLWTDAPSPSSRESRWPSLLQRPPLDRAR